VKDPNPESGDADRWESVTLNVKRPVSAVVSVRMPQELLVAVEAYAQARSLTVSDVVRLATERLIKGVEQVPTFGVVATAQYQLKLAGPTVMMYAVTLGTLPIRSEQDLPPYLPVVVQ
jgi:predicted DNA-binding protein